MGGIAPGARLADRYLVLEELGRGGMGVVYLARDQRDARDVAVKVLREAPEGEGARRLQREARAMGVLDPKGVAQVYEVGETPGGELYLVMEYVPGRTLRSMLRKGRVERSEALKILRQLATTLGQAHRAGLVHRDVKPDNVMVCADGRAVLLDFGIVKRLAVGEETANLSTQLTAEGSVIGTPAYLSPEQALGRQVGPETDQFALGVMAYELLSGKLPWTATEMTTMLAQVLAETPQPPSSIDTLLSPAFDAVLSRVLQKTPGRRFATTDEFADALEAADRGEYVPLEVSETLMAPVTTTGGAVVAAKRTGLRRSIGAAALLGLAVGGVFAARAMKRPAPVSSGSVARAVAALSSPEGRLACPIFEMRGVTDVADRLGAAGATLACMRAAWSLGGRDDRVLPPAALLGVPRGPTPGLVDPYSGADLRARTIELARTRGAAYLDGVATHEADVWHVALVVNAPDGVEIARSEGRDARYLAAVADAMQGLWRPPLTSGALDPDVSRWTGLPSVELGLAATDVSLLAASAACALVRQHKRDLANAYFPLDAQCRGVDPAPGIDAGAPVLDESSPSALSLSVEALTTPLPAAESRRLVARLDESRSREKTNVGGAALARAAGLLATTAGDGDAAQAEFLAAVGADPLDIDAWHSLVAASTLSTESTSTIAAAWIPFEPMFLTKAGSYRGDELAERLRDARLAYELEPIYKNALHYGPALAEAGRAEEARAVAATHLSSPEESRRLEAYVLAYVDLHGAKLMHALERLKAAGDVGMNDLLIVSSVAGTLGDVAKAWVDRFLSLPDDQIVTTARGYDAPMVLCMHARADLARRCLDRISRLGHADINWWGEGGEALLEGAKRYAAGDVRGAVSSWRPLVAAPNPEIVTILPTEAFERAGQPDLAARLDARKLPYTFIAGVSEAAPREAKRALAAGDKARARDLAQKVISAWEVADVEVPAVAEMRALLKSIKD